MRPAVRYRDPVPPIKQWLAANLAAAVGGSPAPTVGVALPPQWTTKSAPALVVFNDGGAVRWPVLTRPTVRVTTWGDGRDRAMLIASTAWGLLTSQPIADIARIDQPTALIESRDRNTGGLMVSFTVRAACRTIPIPA